MADHFASEVAGRDPQARLIVKRLHGIIEHLELLNGTTTGLADRITGVGPKPTDQQGKLQQTNGFLSEATELVAIIESRLTQVTENLRRFDKEF